MLLAKLLISRGQKDFAESTKSAIKNSGLTSIERQPILLNRDRTQIPIPIYFSKIYQIHIIACKRCKF